MATKEGAAEAAETEAAWIGCGQKEGLEIWRIVKFKLETWPEEKHGQFYDGDSYIVLNTYKDGTEICYDLHFWIGQHSTQDEYGTAAYKTVELDTYLEDKPIQHRETQGHETALFKSYFEEFKTMKGGADSGFRKVEEEVFQKRLLHVTRIGTTDKIEVKEVNCYKSNLDSGDVFILDLGMEAHQWNGKRCEYKEKSKAQKVLQKLNSKERMGKMKIHVHDEDTMDRGDDFYSYFDKSAPKDIPPEYKMDPIHKLFRVSDEGGLVANFKKEREGKIELSHFDDTDCFVYDSGPYGMVFVYIGSKASQTERLSGFLYGDKYLKDKNNPYIPICMVRYKDVEDPKKIRIPTFIEAMKQSGQKAEKAK